MTPPTTSSIPRARPSEEKSAWPRWKRVKVSDLVTSRSQRLGNGLSLRFAVAHDMTELADQREAAVEDAGAGGIERPCRRPRPPVKAITASTKSSSSRLMTLAAPYSSARFSLPLVPTVPMTVAPACDGELRREQADAAADRVDQHDVARLGRADVVEQMPGGQPLDGERRRDVERPCRPGSGRGALRARRTGRRSRPPPPRRPRPGRRR